MIEKTNSSAREFVYEDTDRPRLSLGKSKHIMEYVGGPHPYYWIGAAGGEFFGAVNASELRRFVNAPLKFQETEDA